MPPAAYAADPEGLDPNVEGGQKLFYRKHAGIFDTLPSERNSRDGKGAWQTAQRTRFGASGTRRPGLSMRPRVAFLALAAIWP
jgi:hypothetical protein